MYIHLLANLWSEVLRISEEVLWLIPGYLLARTEKFENRRQAGNLHIKLFYKWTQGLNEDQGRQCKRNVCWIIIILKYRTVLTDMVLKFSCQSYCTVPFLTHHWFSLSSRMNWIFFTHRKSYILCICSCS